MRKLCSLMLLFFVCGAVARGSVFGLVQGIVHDPQHRPVRGAQVTVRAANSGFEQTVSTDKDGGFSVPAVPLGDYVVTVTQAGFGVLKESFTLASNTSAMLHLELQVGSVEQAVTVTTQAGAANVDSVTPTTLVNRIAIAQTPGADRTNGMEMITDYVPGTYVTHDQLHMRGGHQMSWQIDGVEIPNTNISSNLGAQIDPKDIDYLEVQRGSYTADVGDRTYGVFNVVPRTGFEYNNEGEVVVSAGSFRQTNLQVNLGSHTEKFAYYASVTGNRSDYGLAPPVERVLHDAANAYGGFASLIYNRTPEDQFRLVTQVRGDYFQIPYDPDPESVGNRQYDSSGLRDGQRETDGMAVLSWVHSFSSSTVLQVAPFYHYNRADYESGLSDVPVATTSDRGSSYAGLQVSMTGQVAGNTLQAGMYGFGQRDTYLLGSRFTDGSFASFLLPDRATGGVVEGYVSDNYKVQPWLTLIGGVRVSHFAGDISDTYVAPRVGVAVQVPKLNWVLRGFYGRFYQPPPLLTANGPVIQFAQANNTTFKALYGERDEEHQFGVQIPWRGWLLDADTFRTRANNFLDHSNVGGSSLYYPVTLDGALIRGWELSIRSPRLGGWGQAHLAYSNQIAEQRGAITGGLVCFPISSPECGASFAYIPLDHDQRNTLSVGFDGSLRWKVHGSTNVRYGSGFHNGLADAKYPGEYLSGNTTFDLALSRAIGGKATVSVNALNVPNHRVLLDNSVTFGGFHYNDPRQIYGEVRYRFKY